MSKPSPMGATFAERTAAMAGKASFTDPTPEPDEAEENTTFAERAKAAKAASKSVDSGDAEDKAVKSAAKKTAAKS